MPYKDNEKKKQYNKKYGKEWYRRNREKTIARSRVNRRQKREEWKNFKASLSCTFCGFRHEAVIEFHHPKGSERYDTKVHNYVQAGQWKKAYKEVEKCVPLCSNCHRILHYNERLGEETMLTKEQIEAWDHFKIADKICNRAKRGLPQDRWMRGDTEMYAMVKAYMDISQIVQNLHNDIVQRGLDSMSIGEQKKGAEAP